LAFPQPEIYSLTNHMRRAAVSVPSNIAEGQARYSSREFRHFLRTSRGSLPEFETQILIAQRRNYFSEAQAAMLIKQADEVSCILSRLIDSLPAV
jgi:four helix bundle protein